MIAIVMGVSGSGKSYFAERLAKATGWPFAEGDDYHSAANKAKMHAEIPLTDEDRLPWLDTLHDVMAGWHADGKSGILTCSALKVSYRARLIAGLPEARFIWIDPPRSVLEEHVTHRSGHFMPAALLDSQLATLEPPTPEEHVLRLDGSQSIDDEIAAAVTFLKS